VEDLQGHPFPQDLDADALKLKYNQLQALGWWRIMRGNAFPTNAPAK
jgi:hypothetical protein